MPGVLFTTTEAAANSDAVDWTTSAHLRDQKRRVQLTVSSGSPTVKIQGKIHSAANWVDLATLTTTAIAEIAHLRYIRVSVVSNTGTVTVYED